MIIENCPKCDWPLSQESRMDNKSFFNCPSCDAYVAIQQDSNKTRRMDKFARVDSQSLTRYQDHRGMTLSYKWKRNYFAIIFTIFWNAITWTVIFGLIGSGKIKFDEFNPAYLLGITHPTVGFITAYWALSGFFNKTYIRIGGGKISILSRPLPWFGDKEDLSTNDINQLYIVMYVAYRQNRRPVYQYKLMAKKGGEEFVLIRGVPNYELALTLEKEIESLLGIEDRPVEGEHRPVG